jgi:hypothetical protein
MDGIAIGNVLIWYLAYLENTKYDLPYVCKNIYPRKSLKRLCKTKLILVR